ncbi:MAG: clostripain-related cysteine peptidase, partial [Candidatus Atribacteria bacterium]|nr:clostripain-related cysteine peptidase [Candidatus Atribacteria bacterium]
LVGMDACFMAMTEVAYQIKDYADLLVTSEESEPLKGWPYDTILSQLVSNPLMSPEELATDIVDKYIYSYPFSNVTQSAIDLSYMDTLAGQLSNLALAIMSDSVTTSNDYIIAAYNSQYYSQSTYAWEKDFIDLYDFCNQLLAYSNSLEVKNIALIIQQTLNSAIINSDYHGASVSGSKGLSIYFPWYYAYNSNKYNSTNFAQDTFWDEMLLSLGL